MFSAFRSLLNRQPSDPDTAPRSWARKLAAERESRFFAWFHLEADGEPLAESDWLRHRFRPAGDSFRALVVLDVTVDAGDGIRSAELCLDRSFVSGPDDAFARDLAKSFLEWVLDDAAREQAAVLIANIGNLAAASAPVIAAEPLPQPPRDATGAYAVFTGDADAATLLLGSALVTLANHGGRLTIEAALEG
jgi:hypothetical protein